MEYFVILIVLVVTTWLLFARYSLLLSILISGLTISATNLTFPFWKIYSPHNGVDFLFIIFFLGLPIAILNTVAIARIIKNIHKEQRSNSKSLLALMILIVGSLFLGIGILHNSYQSNPEINLKLYLKPREQIVNLIKSGALYSQRNCLKNIEQFEGYCQEEIKLPEQFQGLSRNGTINLIKKEDQLIIRFTHSTYNFGEGSINITYFSSDNGAYPPKWIVE